jgi:subtilase family serine protease
VRTSALLYGLIAGGLCLCSAHEAGGQGANVIGRIDVGPLDANALKTAVDLVAKEVGLGGLGQIVFTLHNRGGVSVNVGSPKVPNASINTPPIKIDLYVGGALVQSVYQQGLAGNSSRVMTVPMLNNVPKCGETRAIKVVIDPGNVIPELHDENNSTTATVPRPCPDLAIQSIKRESSGIAGETYRVLVTIVNKGTAASPPDEVWATALTSAPGLNGWPETVPMHTMPGLAPGATYSFRVGGTVASVAHSWVRVFVDIKRLIEESDETNNLVDKTL